MGEAMARAGHTLVYGGGGGGLMGAVADGAIAGGGHTVGVIPRDMMTRELAHTSLDELIVVDSMHERKAEMARRADAFVALPGGMGTFDEFFEAWTWGSLSYHNAPCALLNVDGFYDGLLAFLDTVTEHGFIDSGLRNQLVVAASVTDLLARLTVSA
jgi:uncharacterized protein (TIGR00730 family)